MGYILGKHIYLNVMPAIKCMHEIISNLAVLFEYDSLISLVFCDI